MPRLNLSELDSQRRANRLLSAAVLAGIAAWMGVVGWLVGGWDGVVWSVVGLALVALLQPARSVRLLRSLYGARPLMPAQAPGLSEMVFRLAERSGLAVVPRIFYIPRPEPMALSTGWGRDAAIALSDGMLRMMGPRHLSAVLAHEMAHLRNGDLKLLRLAEAAGRLTRLSSFVGLMLVAMLVAGAADISVAVVVMLVAAPLVSDLLMLKLSRTREFAADAAAAETIGDPAALIESLSVLERAADGGWERVRSVRRPSWLDLIRTHPTTAERIERLRALVPTRRYAPLDWAADDMLVALMDQWLAARNIRRW